MYILKRIMFRTTFVNFINYVIWSQCNGYVNIVFSLVYPWTVKEVYQRIHDISCTLRMCRVQGRFTPFPRQREQAEANQP